MSRGANDDEIARLVEGSGGGRASAPAAAGGLDTTPAMGSMGRIGSGGEGDTTWRNFICRSTHPVAAFFHLVFKVAAVVLYIFGSWFSLEYVTTFVMCILLLAFDFWTVKNITGRLMVGLRWWVHIKEDGVNEWLFESSPGTTIPALDFRIFWWTLYLTPVAWSLLAVLSLLRFAFDWLLIDLVAVALTGANLVGYFKCSADAQTRLQQSLATGAMTGLSYLPGALPALGTSMLGSLFGAATAAAATTTAAAAPGAAAPARPVTTGPDAGSSANPFTGGGGGGGRAGKAVGRDNGVNPFHAVDAAHDDNDPLV